MASFLQCAKKNVTDIKAFIKDASNANGIKYRAERNTKHLLYIPVVSVDGQDADGNAVKTNTFKALSAKVHEGNDANQKYYAYMCLDGKVREDDNGEVVNDGTCPYCERINDAWEIYKYRLQLAESAGKTAEDLEAAKRTALEERKVKEANDYLYLIVSQIKLKTGLQPEINATTSLPEYETKIMKISKSKAEKLMNIAEDNGINFAGCEVVFNYPDTDDARLLSGQASITVLPAGGPTSVVGKYPKLKELMDEACEKFEWEDIVKVYPEWKGTTTKEAKLFTNAMFKQYDSYKKELENNPTAIYLEYVSDPGKNGNKPALGDSTVDPNVVFDQPADGKKVTLEI